MRCEYCRTFQTTRTRNLTRVGNTTISERLCPTTNKNVTSSDESCTGFVLSTFFWCEVDDNWIAVLACKNRQQKQQCHCKRGKEVLDVLRGKRKTTPVKRKKA